MCFREQGLIKAPQPASKRSEAAAADASGDDGGFWDKQGRNGYAKQLQSTEDALPGGRPSSTQPEQTHVRGAHMSVSRTSVASGLRPTARGKGDGSAGLMRGTLAAHI